MVRQDLEVLGRHFFGTSDPLNLAAIPMEEFHKQLQSALIPAHTRSFSNRMPVLSSLSGHETSDFARVAVLAHAFVVFGVATGASRVRR